MKTFCRVEKPLKWHFETVKLSSELRPAAVAGRTRQVSFRFNRLTPPRLHGRIILVGGRH